MRTFTPLTCFHRTRQRTRRNVKLLLCTSKRIQSPYVTECVINLTNQNNSSILGGVALIEMDRAGLSGWEGGGFLLLQALNFLQFSYDLSLTKIYGLLKKSRH